MDLNTVLILLGALALVVLVVHGVWSNKQNKSKIFKNEKPSSKEAPLNTPTEKMALAPEAPLETVVRKEELPLEEVTFPAQNHTAPVEVADAEVSHIKISLRDRDVYSLTIEEIEKSIDLDEGLDVHSPAIREQLLQASKGRENKERIHKVKENLNKEEPSEPVIYPMDRPSEEKVVEKMSVSYEMPRDKKTLAPKKESEGLANAQKDAEESTPAQEAKNNDASEASASTEQASKVVMLYLVAPEEQDFQGEELAKALEKEGMLFGDKAIYHRHSEFSAKAPVLFSLANLENPGTFEPEKMEEFRTFGVVLFMQLPANYGSSEANLRMMISTAKALAKDLNGILLTEQQKDFDAQAEQEYLQQVSTN